MRQGLPAIAASLTRAEHADRIARGRLGYRWRRRLHSFIFIRCFRGFSCARGRRSPRITVSVSCAFKTRAAPRFDRSRCLHIVFPSSFPFRLCLVALSKMPVWILPVDRTLVLALARRADILAQGPMSLQPHVREYIRLIRFFVQRWE
jgi:hypothetical protein